MKILHVCLASFFPDNYSYQENMLPKFHKQQGHEVEVIASLDTFDENGKASYYEKASQYRNEYDIPVTRLAYREPIKVFTRLRRYVGTAEALEKAAPDLMFIHGCQFLDMDVFVRYCKKHPNIRVYVDNHADFSNSARNWLSRNVLHGIVWKHCAHIIEPYVTKFYGVLPVRVDFLKNVYGLPEQKCELLVMGADDEKVAAAAQPEVRQRIRQKYGLAEDDIVVMTGGKIDAFKTQTLLLMEAVQNIDDPRLKLVVFGSVTPDLKEQVNARADGEKVQYIGWVEAKNSYDYFAAADLVVFPGRHSVFWEQVAAQGIPMLVKSWDGTHHVDLGGNVHFLYEDKVEEIQGELEALLKDPQRLANMKKVAMEKGMKTFSYNDISRRAIAND